MSTYGHGPTRREQRVLDLWEQNKKSAEIAEITGLDLRYVQQVISNLGAPIPDAWHASARFGSQALIAAIRRHHPDRCGAAS